MEPVQYKNGNTTVTIFGDGTKIREYEGSPSIMHPESIDVKITDYCDMGCSYCHESSTRQGQHADLNNLLNVIEVLPAGVELAIGGGNPLSHPDLVTFLQVLKNRGLIANITVNQGHLKPYHDLLKTLIKDGLVKGVGISMTNNNFSYVYPLLELTDNVVFHVIAGVNKPSIIDTLMKMKYCKVLILGYKYYGFGVEYLTSEVTSCLTQWYKMLPRFLQKITMSFDNLAIEQLNVQRLFTKEGWEKFYMGDDFCFTMYIDAVKKEYAPTSRSGNRVSFDTMNLIEYFSTRNKTN